MVFTPKHHPDKISLSSQPIRRWLSLFMIATLVVALGGYIALTNAVATKGYEIKDLEQTLAELKVITRELEASAAAKQFSVSVEQSALPAGFVAVERVEYLASTPQVGVAVK